MNQTLIQSFGLPVRGAGRLPQEGEVVGGHYRLVRRLGEGMFGRVYLAERTDVPEHRVALKVTHREVYGGRDVERELVMLAAAAHPHVVQLKDHGTTRDYVWLTMPLYEGETLAERLERGPLNLREAHEIFVPIARGVHALHERGMRHQDIKPENIFLAVIGRDMHPVLLDLGVAVEARSTFVAGTALYGAPEQIVALGGLQGHIELSEKVDTYCLAATLLRALVGAEVFPGERASTPYALATAIEERETTPLAEDALPELRGEPRRMLEAAFIRWLGREPELRPDASTFADELDVLLAKEREAARLLEAGINRQKSALRQVRIALGVVVGLGAAAGVWAYSHRETLRLARELDRARAQGAASFEELDTCVAAHRLAAHDAEECNASRKDDQARHAESLAATTTRMQAVETEQTAERGRIELKLTVCTEDARKAETTCTDERETFQAKLLKAEESAGDLREKLTAATAHHTACELQLEQRNSEAATYRDKLATCLTQEPGSSAPSAGAPLTP